MRNALLGLSLLLLLTGCSENGSERLPTPAEPDSAATESVAPEAAAELPAGKLNVNSATRDQFLTLPEVSERMAHEFDEYRPYASIRQFRREIGKYVDEAQVARYEQHLFVPIAINECDAETLQQIPGVDDTIAAAIIAARPFATSDAALEVLGAHVNADAIEIARSYMTE